MPVMRRYKCKWHGVFELHGANLGLVNEARCSVPLKTIGEFERKFGGFTRSWPKNPVCEELSLAEALDAEIE